MKDGDKLLDFGCGWGSWIIYVATHFRVVCYGMTISQNQFDYAQARIQKLDKEVQGRITILLTDYRNIKKDVHGTFNKITCFEMSEHVGIRNYQYYMAQVKELLEPDGLFFL